MNGGFGLVLDGSKVEKTSCYIKIEISITYEACHKL